MNQKARKIVLSLTLSVLFYNESQAQYNYTTLSFPGSVWDEAYGISGNYVVGAYSYPIGDTYGFLYDVSSQTYTTLPFVPRGISGNNIVGGNQVFNLEDQTYITLNVPGSDSTIAYGISGNDVVGFSDNSGFHFNGSSYTILNVPFTGYTAAYGISGNKIVGYYFSGGVPYAFLYNGSSYTTLGVPGASYTEAYGISGNDIVGYYNSSGNSEAFLYDGNSYNSLDVPGAEDSFAFGISGNEIVGAYASSINGEQYGFLATPVPEPTTLTLMGLCAGTLVIFGSRIKKNSKGRAEIVTMPNIAL